MCCFIQYIVLYASFCAPYLQLVTGEDSTFYVMKKYCFSTLQSAEYLVKEHKTVNKATGQ